MAYSFEYILQTVPTEESKLDLCQFVALIIIPALLEGAQGNGGPNRELLSWFNKAYNEVTGGTGQLTRKALGDAFKTCNEFGVPDDVLDTMIEAAGGAKGSLEQALTGDLGQFNLEWKERYTTNLEDVLGRPAVSCLQESRIEKKKEKTQDVSLLRQKVTLPFVDFVAENYRRASFVMVLYGAGVITYVAYIYGVTDSSAYDYWAEFNCDADLSDLGCSVIKGIIGWLVCDHVRFECHWNCRGYC